MLAMSIATEWVHYDGHLGYLASPDRAKTPLPAVIVIQEVWGVDAHIQDVTRRIAAAGYAALAPDLLAVNGERPPAVTADRITETQAFMNALPPAAWKDPALREAELAKLPSDAHARIGETYKTLFAGIGNLSQYVPALVAAVRYLRDGATVAKGQKVACVGFCMGGGLSALLAANEPTLSGAANFYGSSPPAELVPRIACPVMGFYGGLDERINSGVPAFAAAMKSAGKSFEAHTYEGAQHAFFNDTRPAYDVRAVRDSFARFLEFLRLNLAA
jgi:carboxymethylenebutenolidase